MDIVPAVDLRPKFPLSICAQKTLCNTHYQMRRCTNLSFEQTQKAPTMCTVLQAFNAINYGTGVQRTRVDVIPPEPPSYLKAELQFPFKLKLP